ncbi:MAG: hypothetical protein OXI87_12350, partial [Albidovulum sp.]|nr:hypothetical protein [Albidovulum sp.]
MDGFVKWFPGVEEERVRAVLEHEAEALRTALARWSCFSTKTRQPRCGTNFRSIPSILWRRRGGGAAQ